MYKEWDRSLGGTLGDYDAKFTVFCLFVCLFFGGMTYDLLGVFFFFE